MAYPYLALAAFLVTQVSCGVNSSSDIANDTYKDMYIIHAMVYQVGIITNSTDDLDRNATGQQEALTVYRTNGSNIDFSEIPGSLLTNITGQSLIVLAPQNDKRSMLGADDDDDGPKDKQIRDTIEREMLSENQEMGDTSISYVTSSDRRMTRDTVKPDGTKKDLVKLTAGASVIPQEALVHSVGIPPLLTFNNNLSEIPVPIPNTAVVQYSKINTLFMQSNSTKD